jgi:hypothetical protein
MGEFKGPIVIGAYYEMDDGRYLRAFPYGSNFEINGVKYLEDGRKIDIASYWEPDIVRRVYITHTDPAEVVAELTARSEAAYAKQTAYDGGYHQAVSNAYESAADLVAEKLGVKP